MKASRFFKKVLLILMAISVISLSSCSQDTKPIERVVSDPILRDDFTNASIDGNLTHVQYYNKHDIWDFRSLQIKLIFSDDVYYLSMYDTTINFDCSPEKPINGVTAVQIINCYYLDYKGNKHLIQGRKFFVKIVDYPYSDDFSDYALMILPFFVVFASIAGVIILSFKPIRKIIHE